MIREVPGFLVYLLVVFFADCDGVAAGEDYEDFGGCHGFCCGIVGGGWIEILDFGFWIWGSLVCSSGLYKSSG